MKRVLLRVVMPFLLALPSCAGGSVGSSDTGRPDAGDAAAARDAGGPDDHARADARTEIDGLPADLPDLPDGVEDGVADDVFRDVPADAAPDGDPGADLPDDATPPVDAAGEEDASDTGPGDPGAPDEGPAEVGTEDSGPEEVGPEDFGSGDLGPEDPGAGDPDVADAGYTGLYAGMESLTGQALVDRLCPLVRDGHVRIPYDQADELMRDDIDQYGGNVREVYTGLWVGNWTGLNKEHTWPQGYFDEGGPEDPDMRSDLYNLFPSDIDYNNRRSSYPFGVVVSRLWPLEGEDLGDPACAEDWPGPGSGCFSLLGTDAAGEKVFEPRDGHKGNAARAVFYFALRYGTADCKVRPLTAFDPYGAGHAAGTEALLKAWSRLDPPDLHERDRNDRIEAYQKVRNPFVDHPEFVERIGFL